MSHPKNNKRQGFDPKTRDFDMDILTAEIERVKEKCRKQEARIKELEADNATLLRRMPKST